MFGKEKTVTLKVEFFQDEMKIEGSKSLITNICKYETITNVLEYKELLVIIFQGKVWLFLSKNQLNSKEIELIKNRNFTELVSNA